MSSVWRRRVSRLTVELCRAAGGADSQRKDRFKERYERRSNADIWALNCTGGNGRMVYLKRLVLTWTERVFTTDTATPPHKKNTKRNRQEVRGKPFGAVRDISNCSENSETLHNVLY